MAGLANERNQAVKDYNFGFWVSVVALIAAGYCAWRWLKVKEELHDMKINDVHQPSVAATQTQNNDLLTRKNRYIAQLEAKVQKYKSVLTPAQLSVLEKQNSAAAP